MKFTDEELSRILSAHAGEDLDVGGSSYDDPRPRVCLLQAAYGAPAYFLFDVKKYNELDKAADWFDAEYAPGWSIREFIAELDKQGLI